MKTKEELVKEVLNDPLFNSILNVVSGSERDKVEGTVKGFIDELAWPLVECFSTLASDPEILEAFKSSMRK
jgi:hypothetical protein